VEALAEFLEAQRPRLGRLILVFGVLQDKDADVMLGRLGGLADRIVLTRPETERAADPRRLHDRLGGGDDVSVTASVPEAMALATAAAGPDDTILVTGSLYTVGAVLAAERQTAAQPGD
jgi:dihydrofolate synthase/folylpolyglutamate synthase